MKTSTQKTQSQCEQKSHPFISLTTPKLKVQIVFPDNGRTKQSFKAECDINTIMSQYIKTGVLPPNYDPNSGQYLDATGYEYQSAMELVAGANSMFQNLSSTIRAKFKNNPAEFLEFCENPDNGPALVEMGLATARPKSSHTPTGEAPSEAPTPPAASPAAPKSGHSDMPA